MTVMSRPSRARPSSPLVVPWESSQLEVVQMPLLRASGLSPPRQGLAGSAGRYPDATCGKWSPRSLPLPVAPMAPTSSPTWSGEDPGVGSGLAEVSHR